MRTSASMATLASCSSRIAGCCVYANTNIHTHVRVDGVIREHTRTNLHPPHPQNPTQTHTTHPRAKVAEGLRATVGVPTVPAIEVRDEHDVVGEERQVVRQLARLHAAPVCVGKGGGVWLGWVGFVGMHWVGRDGMD